MRFWSSVSGTAPTARRRRARSSPDHRSRGLTHTASRPRFVSIALALLGLSFVEPAEAAGRYATALKVQQPPKSDETVITVSFTGEPTYMAHFADAKQRLVVDVVDSDVRGIQPTFDRAVGLVESILTQSFTSGGSTTTRLLVSLSAPAEASLSVDGNQLSIRLGPIKPGAKPKARTLSAPAEAPPAASPDAATPGATSEAAPGAARDATPAAPGGATPAAAPPAQPPAAGESAIKDVRFQHRTSSDDIYIDASGYTSFKEEQPRLGQSRLLLRGVRLPEALERTLDVGAFGGLIESISTRYDAEKKAVLVDVEHKGKVQSHVSEKQGSLTWSFFEPGAVPSSVTGVASDGGVARRARTLHIDDVLTAELPQIETGTDLLGGSHVVEQSQEEQTASFGPSAMAQQERFQGRRIDLDLKDADVHNVLRLLADVGKVNIVTADNVSGSVTIRMRNVPWDQALDVVLQSKNLGMVRRGNIIRVAPLSDLEKEREMQIARRRQELQLAPLETRLVPVSYADAAELQARARELLSGRGSIAVDGRTNVLIARDVTGTLDQVEELVRSLDTQTPQVLIEARIVEATSRYLREIGIQWGGDASFSAATGNPTGLAFPNSVGLAGGASDNNTPTQGLSPFQNAVQNPNFAVNLPATVGAGAGGALGLTLGSVDSNFNLNLRLSAAEQSGMVRILSSPRILTLDNHEARISQGTLIPFSQVSAQGVQTTFQEAKLQLLVQPHVTADGSVSMHVKINRDEPDFNQTSARGDPTILKREAETDLLVMDGNTAVIGGVYTRNTGRNINQVPFFGDIPLLGLLFQRRNATDQRGELVIFLTPRIINRAQALGR
jgi:type IV pilus assembly protein PilQ